MLTYGDACLVWPPTDPAVQCPKHFWENVLFINSSEWLVWSMEDRVLLQSLTIAVCHGHGECLVGAFNYTISDFRYIGTEFIFYLLAPIFLLSLRRSVKLGLLVASATIIVSSILNVITMINYNFPPTQLLWRQPPIFNPDFIQHHLVIYIKPWYRIGPYIVGLLLGYYLAGFHQSPQKKTRSVHFVVGGWLLASAAGFWALYGLYPALQASTK